MDNKIVFRPEPMPELGEDKAPSFERCQTAIRRVLRSNVGLMFPDPEPFESALPLGTLESLAHSVDNLSVYIGRAIAYREIGGPVHYRPSMREELEKLSRLLDKLDAECGE